MQMITTLKVSPQGQITIPKAWRKVLNLKPGNKVLAYVSDLVKAKILTLKPESASWVDEVAATGQDCWGDSDRYIQQERDSWDK